MYIQGNILKIQKQKNAPTIEEGASFLKYWIILFQQEPELLLAIYQGLPDSRLHQHNRYVISQSYDSHAVQYT